jgi:hypothetical protein
MASCPLRKRGVRRGWKHRLRVSLAITAIALPLAGCGDGAGGHDRPTVAASLRHYFSTFNPEDGIFPQGSGPPRIKGNGCRYQGSKKLAMKNVPWRAGPGSSKSDGETVAFWQCSVRFEGFTVPVSVVVDESGEVVWAQPVYGDNRNAPSLSPARTYTG